MNDLKQEFKERARLVRVLANTLGYDAEHVFVDAENFDFVCMNESMKEINETFQNFADNLKELQYLMLLIQRREPQD